MPLKTCILCETAAVAGEASASRHLKQTTKKSGKITRKIRDQAKEEKNNLE